jgi:alkanesulfonate monooxygenase SsuD/methylene tetrahydromethanopterin reductase-like flavin-dependent oxidoreductase (luciferase family)
MRLAGRWADLQFAAPGDLKGVAAHRKKLDEATLAAGRPKRDVGVLWSAGFDVVSGPEEAAFNLQQAIDSVPPAMSIVFLSQWWGMDGYKLDPRRSVHETVAEIKERGIGPNWSYLDEAVRVTDEKTTIGEYARGRMAHPASLCGTPEQIADKMEEAHHVGGANGGFMVYATSGVPSGLARFVHEVVPVLQRRGLMRKDYAGPTMRENLLV